MSATKLVILGAGSVRCSPPVIASLATYFGERPLEIVLYDADEERVDLFDRLARLCFRMTEATHEISYCLDPAEALSGADRVVLQVGTNCARKYLKAAGLLVLAEPEIEAAGSVQKDGFEIAPSDDRLIQLAIDQYLKLAPEEVQVLSLQRLGIVLPEEERFRSVEWPPELGLADRVSVPHQALRYIKGEDYPHTLLQQNERSPLKAWLDDVESAAPTKFL